ncbi:helix-turn-helix domain-containing protein [Dactylosporangium sp. CA-233914]|uniref:helix-turn-helix domain-containing protein n=1 Tax=Dactylosporangium sp. CA-233914 TaxID=3239934 RepID=UPI003D8A29B4
MAIRILFVFDPWSQAVLIVASKGRRMVGVVQDRHTGGGSRVRSLVGLRAEAERGLMTEFHNWQDIRAELDDGDADALAQERARTEAWVSAFHLAEERKRLGMTQREVADLMGVTPGRVSQIENVTSTSTRSLP